MPSIPRGDRSPASRLSSLAGKLLAALWFAVLPALVAALTLRFLVPPLVVGNSDFVKDAIRFAQEQPLIVGVGLFLLFAAVARYWRSSLPGGRYLSAPPARPRNARWEWAWLGVGIMLVASAIVGVRRGLVESYGVLSGSMLPTLQPDDRLLGNRLAYRGLAGAVASPRRGDIVVFKSSRVDDGNLADVPDFLIKRVIGLPGDRISMRGSIPEINGWTVPVCDAAEYLYVLHGGDNGLSGRLLVEFLEDRAYLTVHAAGSVPFADSYVVKPGEVFVLGDNRNNSSDSRAWNSHRGGGVPLDAIEARIDRFVAGRRADLSWDFGRLLRPTGSLAAKIHLDGVNEARVQEGIDKCMQKRPSSATPPAPSEGVDTGSAGTANP